MTQDDLREFASMFKVQLDQEVRMLKPWRFYTPDDICTGASTAAVETEPGYQITISERQLDRLISMLKQKGYYHDDDYSKRMREEELILNHPELKRMHDEYKMMLYFLCGDEWRQG